MSVPKQHPQKTPNNIKTSKKTVETVKFIENPTKDKKTPIRPLKEGLLKKAVRKI